MKSTTLLILLVVVAILALMSYQSVFSKPTRQDALKFFEEDLALSYPSADVREVISINKIGEGIDEYYVLKARVSQGMDTPCPERTEVEYHYPAKNFLKTDEKVVSGCTVCLDDSLHCKVIYPEEAIIASHTFNGTSAVSDFLDAHPDAAPNATLLSAYSDISGVWEVVWTAKDGSSMTAYIPPTGRAALEVH